MTKISRFLVDTITTEVEQEPLLGTTLAAKRLQLILPGSHQVLVVEVVAMSLLPSGGGELPLVFATHAGVAARLHATVRIDELTQEIDVLVVDMPDVVFGEETVFHNGGWRLEVRGW